MLVEQIRHSVMIEEEYVQKYSVRSVIKIRQNAPQTHCAVYDP
jgi:hypothetical protein